MKKLSLVLSAVVLVSLAVWARQADSVKVNVAVTPGTVIVDRTAAGSMNRGVADIFVTFNASADFSKTMQPGQCYELEISSAKAPDKDIWKLSTVEKYPASFDCKLTGGKPAKARKAWSFDPTKVPDGEYKVVLTFLPTGAKSDTTFTVKSGMGL